MNMIGENVQWEITENGVLAIYVDLKAPTRPSKSGKTDVIASTQGNKKLSPADGAPVFLGVNCYRYTDN